MIKAAASQPSALAANVCYSNPATFALGTDRPDNAKSWPAGISLGDWL